MHWLFLSFYQSQKYYHKHCDTDFRDLVKIGESDCYETVDVGLSDVSDWVTDACYDTADTSVFDTWEFQVSFKLSSFILTFMWTSKKSSWKHQKHFFFHDLSFRSMRNWFLWCSNKTDIGLRAGWVGMIRLKSDFYFPQMCSQYDILYLPFIISYLI